MSKPNRVLASLLALGAAMTDNQYDPFRPVKEWKASEAGKIHGMPAKVWKEQQKKAKEVLGDE